MYLIGIRDPFAMVQADLSATLARLSEAGIDSHTVAACCATICARDSEDCANNPFGYIHSIYSELVCEEWPCDLEKLQPQIARDLRLQAAMRLFLESPAEQQSIAAAFLEMLHARLVEIPERHAQGVKKSDREKGKHAGEESGRKRANDAKKLHNEIQKHWQELESKGASMRGRGKSIARKVNKSASQVNKIIAKLRLKKNAREPC